MSLIEVNQAILAWTVLIKSSNLGGIFSLKDLDTIYLLIEIYSKMYIKGII